MLMRSLPVLVACTLYFAAPAAAQVTRPIKFPAIQAEFTVGLTGPQYETAEFPGIVAALAVLHPVSPTVGVGGVAEIEASYVRQSRSIGARVYRRIKYTTLFTQLLAGSAIGGSSGIVSSTGGVVLQPGVGISVGTRTFGFHLQLDYRNVDSGLIYNSFDGSSESQSGVRYMVGFSFHPGR